jgi:hypothetical protein
MVARGDLSARRSSASWRTWACARATLWGSSAVTSATIWENELSIVELADASTTDEFTREARSLPS